MPSHVAFVRKSNGENGTKMGRFFDEITVKNVLAPFYGVYAGVKRTGR